MGWSNPAFSDLGYKESLIELILPLQVNARLGHTARVSSVFVLGPAGAVDGRPTVTDGLATGSSDIVSRRMRLLAPSQGPVPWWSACVDC